MFTETLFWQNLFGFPLWGNLGGRYRGLRRFRIGWRGSEGDRAKLGVRGLRRVNLQYVYVQTVIFCIK